MASKPSYYQTFQPDPIETAVFKGAPPEVKFAVLATQLPGVGPLFPEEDNAARQLVKMAYYFAGIDPPQDPKPGFCRYAVIRREPEEGLGTLFATCCEMFGLPPDDLLPTQISFPEFGPPSLEKGNMEIGRITSRLADDEVAQHLGMLALLRASVGHLFYSGFDTDIYAQVEPFMVDALRALIGSTLQIGAPKYFQEQREDPTKLIPIRARAHAIYDIAESFPEGFLGSFLRGIDLHSGEGLFGADLTEYLGPVAQPQYYLDAAFKMVEAVFKYPEQTDFQE